MATTDRNELRRHVAYKRDAGELDEDVAARMLWALHHGAEPDYQALYQAAAWPPIPPVVYHTADWYQRASIQEHGLRPGGTRHGSHWGSVIGPLRQAEGVYVDARRPDARGVWSHWERWDVWTVTTEGLTWEPDPLNPGCWFTPDVVPPDRLELTVLDPPVT